jgi:hypothetical protein
MRSVRRAKTASAAKSTPVNELAREAGSILELLAAPEAYGWIDAAGVHDRLRVASRQNGVSVGSRAFRPAAAETLCSAGLAEWETGLNSGRRRLRMNDVGRAHLARRAAGGADPFLAQHTVLTQARLAGGDAGFPIHNVVVVDQSESPLAWLATRKGADGNPLIDAASFEAGERLRRDFTFAGMEPRMTADWSQSRSRGAGGAAPTNHSDLALAARQRVEAALDFVGSDFAGLLLDVCGFLKGLELVERERQWPRRSAKLVLVLALRQLARHYGVASEARGPARSTGVRHWGADDYRPSISAD